MITSEWNTLQPGDRVVVHEHVAPANVVPVLGVVEVVSVDKRTNQVGIRLETESGSQLAYPTRLAVHAETIVARALCPWCSQAGAVDIAEKRPA